MIGGRPACSRRPQRSCPSPLGSRGCLDHTGGGEAAAPSIRTSRSLPYVIIIDGEIIIGGSFTYTNAAQEKNTENVEITRDKAVAARYTANRQTHARRSEPYVEMGMPQCCWRGRGVALAVKVLEQRKRTKFDEKEFKKCLV
jgi:hypothetical protein